MVSVKSPSYIAVLLHLFSWLLFASVLLFYQPLSWNIAVPYQFWVKQGIVLLFLVILFYGNSYLLVPQSLLKDKNLYFVSVILLIVVITGPIFQSLDHALGLPELMGRAFEKTGRHGPPKRENHIDIFLLLMTLLMVGISTSLTLIQKWHIDKQTRELLEKEKIGSELSFLKAQINPHFFFNTLNNIYALTHIDVDGSRIALHKLSRMMRYLLYETSGGSTPLSKEISFITDYVELMKLRLNEFTTINYTAPALDTDPQIAPMIFLPYIENAFKYGVSTTEPAVIDIIFFQNETTIDMFVKNTIFASTEQQDGYGGIGLLNTRRRLELLYPDNHSLNSSASEDGKTYSVHIKLKFA
ncbi:sensor histidine kinase [Pedobacter duraquae]|uniref:Histidine kinase n=1 Tax=Pedobacter duraquae TaxID=425511 RepID=A0A4R6IEQ0_9SPHI|nr:sensor histidine kinase [Pedobacter duraquae]TDO20780.1 histidine kinase [Pedobacter duraquae]